MYGGLFEVCREGASELCRESSMVCVGEFYEVSEGYLMCLGGLPRGY